MGSVTGSSNPGDGFNQNGKLGIEWVAPDCKVRHSGLLNSNLKAG